MSTTVFGFHLFCIILMSMMLNQFSAAFYVITRSLSSIALVKPVISISANEFAREDFSRPNMSSLRKLYLHHHSRVPILYIPGQFVKTSGGVSLEHIVPVSELPCETAAKDAQNIFLADARINCARGNRRFCFEPIPLEKVLECSPEIPSVSPDGIKTLGYGNFIDTKTDLFYPRFQDIGVIARCILRMNKKWDIPLNKTTTASHFELETISRANVMKLDEYFHKQVSRAYNIRNTNRPTKPNPDSV